MDATAACYGYGRHSTAKQELTQEAQEFRVTEYYERHLKPQGVRWGGFFYDAATSGRTPFSEREKGRVLHAIACPGDHIVVAKLDRPFRSLRDGVVSMEQWAARGVNFHSLDIQVDTSTPMGRFFRTVILAVAELEREFARERTIETTLARKRQGLPHSQGCPVGWKIVGQGSQRRFRVDEDERRLVDAMQEMRDDGHSHDDIALWGFRQKLYPNKRIFPTRGQIRACLNARGMGYPKISSYREINRLASEAKRGRRVV